MMKEVRKFKIEPQWKKSVVESEFFRHPEKTGTIEVVVCWRGGEYYIDIDDDNIEELTMMDQAMKDPEEAFEVTAFEGWELDSTWDGVSEDLYFHNMDADFDEEAFKEEYDGDDGGWDYLVEDQRWDADSCEIWIQNGVTITEEKSI